MKKILLILLSCLSYKSFAQYGDMYRIIPPCSLCSKQETKIITDPEKLDTEFTTLTRNINTLIHNEHNDDNEHDNESDTNKWILDKKSYPRLLKINYKDSFDVYFKKLSLIQELSKDSNYTLDIRISPTIMTLFLYTPDSKGLSRRDFKMAYEISKAMSEKPQYSSTISKRPTKSTRYSLEAIKTLILNYLPAWTFSLTGGRNITRTFQCKSYKDALNALILLGQMDFLEYELSEVYLDQTNTITITIQRQIGKTLYAETLAFAQELDRLLIGSHLVNNVKSKRTSSSNHTSTYLLRTLNRYLKCIC